MNVEFGAADVACISPAYTRSGGFTWAASGSAESVLSFIQKICWEMRWIKIEFQITRHGDKWCAFGDLV